MKLIGAVGPPAYALKGVYEEVSRKHLRYSLITEGEKQLTEWDKKGVENKLVVLAQWKALERDLIMRQAVEEEDGLSFNDKKYA